MTEPQTDSVVEPELDIQILLGAAGIHDIPERDLRSLARLLPGVRRRIDRMYDVATGDEVTAAVFRADEV